MTSRQERNKLTAVWVLAPLTAGLLSVSTTWALEHNPLETVASSQQSASGAKTPAPISASALRSIESRVAAATRRYETARLSLLDVERRIHLTAQQIGALKKTRSGGSASLPGLGATAVSVPPVGSPPPPPASTPPVVNTTTGAS